MFTIACHIYVSSNKRGRIRLYTYKYTFIKIQDTFFKGHKKVTEVAGPPTPPMRQNIFQINTPKNITNYYSFIFYL